MILALVGSVFAAEPTMTVENGAVVARVHVPASEAEVREVLQDPVESQELVPEVRSVEAVKKGDCCVVDVETDGMWNPMHYKALRCPTADGWTVTLIDSDDFTALNSEWKLTPTTNGTEIEYRVKTEIGSIPSALVRKGTEKSMRETLMALLAKVVKGQ